MDRVVVIGGGLTGLAAAHRLTTRAASTGKSLEVILLEARDRVGGAIWTSHRDGFVLEGGADSFITNKPWGLELCHELGLEDSLIRTDPNRRRSFVVRHGKLLPVPDGFVMMAPSRMGPILTSPILSWKGKLRMLMDYILPRKTDDSDESLGAFVKRRLGREALDRLVQPHDRRVPVIGLERIDRGIAGQERHIGSHAQAHGQVEANRSDVPRSSHVVQAEETGEVDACP